MVLVEDEKVRKSYIPPAPEAAMLMNNAPMCMGISYCASKSLVDVVLEDMMPRRRRRRRRRELKSL